MPELTDPAAIRSRLETDPAWAAFSLADLEPVHASHAWWCGPSDGTSLVLVYGAYDPPIVFCQGNAAEVEALLGDVEVMRRTPRAYLNVTRDMLPAAQRHFARCDVRPMVRMVLGPDAVLGQAPRAERLGPDDLERLRALYADEPPAFFLPSQLRDGVYFGACDADGALVSVAGTHVVSGRYGVGAIGNVYTRADARRRGLAAEATVAVARELRRLGAATIVLNIVEGNDAARRVYERIGFREYCVYYEGVATR